MNGKPLQRDVYSWQIEATYLNGAEWKGMLFPGSNKPVRPVSSPSLNNRLCAFTGS